MAKGRWQHLDLRKPAPSPPPATPAPPADGAPPAANDVVGGATPPHPEVQRARMLYVLHQFEQCADVLTAALAVYPDIPGARRLLGLSFGRLDLPNDAVHALRVALVEEPDDPVLLGALISAELRTDVVPTRNSVAATGALAEVVGAAEWVRGQHALRAGRPAEAARAFQEAGELFTRYSPPEAAAERVAAAYVGETVSHLAAGQLDAAQRGFSRLGARVRLPEASIRFARGLYELADALRDVDPAERAEELAPLVGAIVAARLRLRFHDGTRPVEMFWENLM